MLRVEKKTIEDSTVFVVTSLDPDSGKHHLFLEWDTVDDLFENTELTLKDRIRGLEALGVKGVLIKTRRGYHFISSNIKTSLKRMMSLQKVFGADHKWIGYNKERGFACLRVSNKYEKEDPLKVVIYPLTDEELKQEYEKIIKKYFYKGDPYFGDADYDNGF